MKKPGKDSTRKERDAWNKRNYDKAKETSRKAGNLQREPTKEVEKTPTPSASKKEVTPVTLKVDEPIRLNEPEKEIPSDVTRLGFDEPKDEGRLTGVDKARLVIGGGMLLGAAALGGFALATAGTAGAVVGSTTVQTTLSGGIVKAAPYLTNTKTLGLTKSILSKAGMAVGVTALVGTVVGTYPFAHFELAEASDKIGIAMFTAAQAGDEEKVIELSQYLEEMLDMNVWQKVLASIPFANVHQAVSKNIAAARKSADSFKERAEEELKRQAEGGESDFERQRREGDEAARERELGYREEDEAYFQGLREESEIRDREKEEEETEKFDRIAKEREETSQREEEEETAKYAGIEEERVAREEEDKRVALVMQDVWRLRREGKYEEADELERTVL